MKELTAPNVQLNHGQAPTGQEQSGMSLGRAIAIFLTFTVIFAAAGYGIGRMFFWNQYSKDSKLDVELKQNLERVQNDTENPANHLMLGISYTKKGENERAVGEFKKVLSLDPKSFSANYYMGLSYMALKQYDKAITVFKEAINIGSKAFGPHANLAIAYYQTNRFEDALKELELANRADPGSPETRYWRGMVYEKQNKLEDAFKQYESALRYAPQYQDAQQALDRMKKALNK